MTCIKIHGPGNRQQVVLGTYLSGLLLFGIAVLGCNRSGISAGQTLLALQQMQNLATAEYTVQKVVKANDNQTWYKWGDRKILITCEAKVKAGIDFDAMETRHVSIQGKSISIQMPEPHIISVQLPPEKIKVAYQETGFFRTQFNTTEQNELMEQAEAQVTAQAKNMGILEDAEKNARAWLTAYLTQLGFEAIDLQFGSPFTIKNPQ